MGHVCAWWQVYTFDNPIRGMIHKPEVIFGPYVETGMVALDVGCGRGHNTLGLARLVGEGGRIIAADLQPQMLNMVRRRAAKLGLSDRITLHQCEEDSIGVEERVDFAVAFWVVHETPDQARFLQEVHACLRPGGRFFIAEPKMPVSRKAFEKTVRIAEETGFRVEARPQVFFCRCVVLVRDG